MRQRYFKWIVAFLFLLLAIGFVIELYSISRESMVGQLYDEDPDELDIINREKTANVSPPVSEGPAPADMSKFENLPFKETTMFATYNSSYNGTKCTIEQLGDVMHSGCRFVDLTLVKSHKDGRLYVDFIKDPDSYTADLSLKFSDVLSHINSFAFQTDKKAAARVKTDIKDKLTFTKSEGPSLQTNMHQYPFFVLLRIHQTSPDADIIQTIYEDYLANTNDKGLITSNFLYTDGNGKAKRMNKDTPMKEIMRKIIFVMDIDNILANYTKSLNAEDVPNKTREAMMKFVNIKTGGHTWRSFHKYDTVETSEKIPLFPKEIGTTTNADNLYIAFPSPGDVKNPDVLSYLKYHRIQTVPIRMYLPNDQEKDKVVRMYKDKTTPFLSLAHTLRYITKLENNKAVEFK